MRGRSRAPQLRLRGSGTSTTPQRRRSAGAWRSCRAASCARCRSRGPAPTPSACAVSSRASPLPARSTGPSRLSSLPSPVGAIPGAWRSRTTVRSWWAARGGCWAPSTSRRSTLTSTASRAGLARTTRARRPASRRWGISAFTAANAFCVIADRQPAAAGVEPALLRRAGRHACAHACHVRGHPRVRGDDVGSVLVGLTTSPHTHPSPPAPP